MKYGAIIFGGIAATTVMSIFGFVAPYIGLPKMDVAAMLSGMLDSSMAVGWILHFMVGTFFANCYAWVFNKWLGKIKSHFLRGMLYGLIVFVFAQIMMGLIGAMGMMPPPPPNVNMMLMVIGSLLGHLLYGAVLGIIVKRAVLTPAVAD